MSLHRHLPVKSIYLILAYNANGGAEASLYPITCPHTHQMLSLLTRLVFRIGWQDDILPHKMIVLFESRADNPPYGIVGNNIYYLTASMISAIMS